MDRMKSCPACGNQFKCGAENGERWCWCFDYVVPQEVLMDLKKNFDGCVCPACLERKISDYEKERQSAALPQA